MLLFSPRSTERFSPAIAFGLRSLLVPQPSGGIVVTRALAAASRCGAGVQESRNGTNIGEENAKTEEGKMQDGLWVSYGRREPRRRLPPPIPSLLARGALRRTRTDDGRRLVIRIAPVAWPECTRSRRRGGRLTMQHIEHDDDSPLTTRSFPSPTTGEREDDTKALEEPDDDTCERVDKQTVPAIGSEGLQEAAEVAAQGEMLPAVPPPRVPSAGCFEDVFKYGSVGGSSLHQMPASLIRMVH